jgi:hypothetical protein
MGEKKKEKLLVPSLLNAWSVYELYTYISHTKKKLTPNFTRKKKLGKN